MVIRKTIPNWQITQVKCSILRYNQFKLKYGRGKEKFEVIYESMKTALVHIKKQMMETDIWLLLRITLSSSTFWAPFFFQTILVVHREALQTARC